MIFNKSLFQGKNEEDVISLNKKCNWEFPKESDNIEKGFLA